MAYELGSTLYDPDVVRLVPELDLEKGVSVYIWGHRVHTVQCTVCANRSGFVTVHLSAVLL